MLNKLAGFGQRFSPTLQGILSNVIWLSADRFIQMGLSLFIGIWVARYLGPDQFGLLNYAVSFTAIFGSLTTLGLNGIVVRDISRDSSCKDVTLGTTFVLMLGSGILTFFLTIAVIFGLHPNEPLTRWVVGIISAGTIFQAFNTIDFWFQSQIQSKYTVVAKNASYVLVCLVRVILIQFHAPLLAFVWVRLLEIVLSAVGLVIVYRIGGYKFKTWKVSLERAKSLLNDSWPLIIAGISTYIYATIDQVMLGQMATTKSVGIYSVAVKISEIWNFIPMIMAQSMLPAITQKHKESEIAFMDSLQKFFDVMAISWLLTAIVVSLFSSQIVATLYGNAYSSSALILSIYVWSQFGSNFGVARSLYINVNNLFKISLIISASGAILNITLNYFLIPLYQELGATIATLITYFFAVILANLIFKDLRKLLPLIGRSLLIHQTLPRFLKEYVFKKP